jgi:hypothetical protein
MNEDLKFMIMIKKSDAEAKETKDENLDCAR